MPTPPATSPPAAATAVEPPADLDYDNLPDGYDDDDAVTPPAEPPAEPAAAREPAPAKSAGLPKVHQETVAAATWEGLQNKSVRRDVVRVPSTDADGRQVILELQLVAISNPEYDRLLDTYPPNREDQAKGAIWDRKRFPAALLERVVTSPKLSFEQWMELGESANWSGGEYGDLFGRANRLCQGGLDVPFTGLG